MDMEREKAEYTEVLRRFHHYLRPKTYLEIGTMSGTSLKIAKCASIAIDPGFELDQDVLAGKPSCLFFQMTSDAFFSMHSPTTLFGQPIELAFLDGMHLAEFLLRDFMNVETHARRNSVIILHDCIPWNMEMTSRMFQDGAWTGDVWKTVIALKKYRPDIKIQALDAPPTGLIICTNLDPSSRLLEEKYHEILDDMASLDLGILGVENFRKTLGVCGTELTNTFEGIARNYWL